MHNQQAFPRERVGAIVVAAGSGTRAGDGPPKQFRMLGRRPLLTWSVAMLQAHPRVGFVCVLVPAGHETAALDILPGGPVITAGGATRTESVRIGLDLLSRIELDAVLIHDAARPGLSADVIDELLDALRDADAAAPALPVSDALKRRDDGIRSVSRDNLVRVQTPQAFRWPVIASAFAANPHPAVDDLALVEAAGARIALTRGREELLKLTYPEDFAVAEKLLAQPLLRVGSGFDVHGFEPGDAVVLCGVRIPHTRKLRGHSDADAGWHALTDAILGALALGDIGDHFPPSDPQWKGADSRVFLQHAVDLAADRNYRIVNADITILAERPKIAPHREAMRIATAEALGVEPEAVSIKATTTEKLGFVGREEGIAAQAVVMLRG